MAYRQTPAVQARLEDTRERILKAARSLVSEGGWQQAQVASVANVAGIATGTVYRYFASKAELFAEVLSMVSQREVDVIMAIVSSEGDATTRLHAAVKTFVKRALRNPRLAYALIAEPCEPEIDAARLTYRAALSKAIKTLIIQGQETGEFHNDTDANIAASVIVGGFMEGLIGPLSPLNHTHQQQHSDQAEQVVMQIATQSCRSVSLTPLMEET